MSGILFLILGLAAAKVAAWQSGILAGVFGHVGQTPDYSIAGMSLVAALIFFGLWRASRIHRREFKP